MTTAPEVAEKSPPRPAAPREPAATLLFGERQSAGATPRIKTLGLFGFRTREASASGAE